MASRIGLGDLQSAIMRVLWQRGEASVSDVHAALQDERRLAPTTIATMLKKMEAKGVVTHRVDGRQFVYRPTVSATDVRRSMVSELVGRVFEGNPAALVSHLMSEQGISREDLEEIRRLLAEHEGEEVSR
jgi:BlaI family transcriptional regulator, penicillinase repressor